MSPPMDEIREEIERARAEQRARWTDLKSRRGHFRIARDLFELSDDSIFKLFGQVIIFRCEYLYDRDMLDYSGLSYLFDSIPDSIETPDYKLEFNRETSEVKAIRLP